MCVRIFAVWLGWCVALGVGTIPASGEELPVAADAEIESMRPVMVSLADRDPPSDEEWEALHEDTDRAGLFGSLGDLKSRTISFMDTQYFTPNCAEGTLASFGKVDGKHRFDRYGHIAGVEFDVPRHSWKERYALNAAALVKLTGKARFAEVAGVELDTAVNDRRQIEVTFVGTMVPKDEAIRRLNADAAALDYLATLYDQRRKYAEKSVKLFAGPAPPEPKVVLANVVMLDGKSSKEIEGSLEGRAESALHGIGGGLKLVKNGGEQIELLSPVVRCYRTYSVEFKMRGGKLERSIRTCGDGQQYELPTVFDLTPDL
jgi:hypothetical protein